MANDPGNPPTQPQLIPLSKIHELPGVFNPKPQDKSLGSMVLSIQNNGVKDSGTPDRAHDWHFQKADT